MKIGRIAVPKLILRDVSLSKDGYSIVSMKNSNSKAVLYPDKLKVTVLSQLAVVTIYISHKYIGLLQEPVLVLSEIKILNKVNPDMLVYNKLFCHWITKLNITK